MNTFLALVLSILLIFSPISYAKAEILLKIITVAAVYAVGGIVAVGIFLVVDSSTCNINTVFGCGGGGGGGGSGSGGGGGGGSSSPSSPVTIADYCTAGGPQPKLSWSAQSAQTAYQIQISTDSNFTDLVLDTGKVLSTSNSYIVPANTLRYNTTYYWRVKLWSDTNETGYTTSTYTSPPHQGPSVNFTWTPSRPVMGGVATFTDASTFFGGSAASAYNWTFPADATPLTAPTTNATEQVKFSRTAPPTGNSVTLSVTDTDDLTCKASKDISLTQPIIDIKEVR